MGTPTVVLIIDGSNEVVLPSSDPDDDDLITKIATTPANGFLTDATSSVLSVGDAVSDGARKQNKRVFYAPLSFSAWTGDSFTYTVQDDTSATPVTATVVLEKYKIPVAENRTFTFEEDTLSHMVLGNVYVTAKTKKTAQLTVVITRLPARGTLFQACFTDGGDGTYTALCASGTSASSMTPIAFVCQKGRWE